MTDPVMPPPAPAPPRMIPPDTRHFADVTLLITHYNRSRSLERLLAGFRGLGCSFADVVVSDDGSRAEHLTAVYALQRQYGFRLVTTPVNRGLGHNNNKGQAVVQTAYTLYVQEDFVPKPALGPRLSEALTLMQQDPTLDLVRLYAYFPYPYQRPRVAGFADMVFRPLPWHTNHLKFYVYSDHPHLRRRSFAEKFGRYAEDKQGDAAEFAMCLSFLKQGGKGVFLTEFSSVFEQANLPVEPSTATFRTNWPYSKPAYLYLRKLYLVYRFLKNSLQLVFFTPQTVTHQPPPEN